MSPIARTSSLLLSATTVVVIAACGSSSTDPGFGNPSSSSSGGSGGSGGSSGGSGGGSSGGGSGGQLITDSGSGGSSSGTLSDAGCATAHAKMIKTPVYIEFILDGSGSMTQPSFPISSKWGAATQALTAVFQSVQAAQDPAEGVGLMVFADSGDLTGGNGPYPGATDVPINFVGSSQLSSLTTRVSGLPSGDTPTGIALTGAYAYVEGYTPLTPLPPGGQKVVVLITDGVPTHTGDPCVDASGNSQAGPCVALAQAALAQSSPQGPVLTFVIGTGTFPSTDLTNYDPTFLGQIAAAGGTAPTGCNPTENANAANLCYFNIDPNAGSQTQVEQAFENAINAIRGQVISCTFPLTVTSDAGAIDPSQVNVTVNGTAVPQDPTNGWSYDNPTNPTKITLNGSACTNLKNDPNATVNVVLGCATCKTTSSCSGVQ